MPPESDPKPGPGAVVAPPFITQASAESFGLSRRKFLDLVKAWGLPHTVLGRSVVVRTAVLLSALEQHETVRAANDSVPEPTGDAAVDAVLARVGLARVAGSR